jgi:hypothetical protein
MKTEENSKKKIGNVSGTNQPLRVTVKTSNLGHTMLIQGGAGGSGRGICKSVIRSGRLSTKLPNPHAPRPLDQHHVTQIRSLHGCMERLVCTTKRYARDMVHQRWQSPSSVCFVTVKLSQSKPETGAADISFHFSRVINIKTLAFQA